MKPKNKRFLVLTYGRSGSSLLCDLLDQHPDLRCQSEILSTKTRNPKNYINGIARVFSSYQCYGFKAKISQIENQSQSIQIEAFLEEIQRDGWQIYILLRRNTLDSALSSLVAWKRGDAYHNLIGTDSEIFTPVELKSRQVILKARAFEAAHIKLEQLAEKFCIEKLYYEDHLCDPVKQQIACSKIFSDLGLDDFAVHARFRPTSTDRLEDAIVDSDSLIKELKKTELSRYL